MSAPINYLLDGFIADMHETFNTARCKYAQRCDCSCVFSAAVARITIVTTHTSHHPSIIISSLPLALKPKPNGSFASRGVDDSAKEESN